FRSNPCAAPFCPARGVVWPGNTAKFESPEALSLSKCWVTFGRRRRHPTRLPHHLFPPDIVDAFRSAPVPGGSCRPGVRPGRWAPAFSAREASERALPGRSEASKYEIQREKG